MVLFVYEEIFISEQIREHRLGTSLKISDKSSSTLNSFTLLILQCLLSFTTELYDFEKHYGLEVLLERL